MSTVNESSEHRNVQLKPYAYFDFRSQKEVPESHVWDPPEDVYVYPVVDEPIPIIDLTDPLSTLLPELARACKQWGAFQLKGHGFPMELLERAETECFRLFALPDEQKHKALRPNDGSISGYGTHLFSRNFSKSFWSECYTMAGDPAEGASKLWPEDHHGFCEVMREYRERMKVLSLKLIQLLLASLGSSLEETGWKDFKDATPVLHANWYPPCPDPDRAMGIGPHTDSSLVTIMYQFNETGFQVMLPAADHELGRRPDRWVTVPRTPGVLVVNLGDLLHIISNGLYPSALHRAVVTEGRERHTLVTFIGPPADARIATIKSLLGTGERPRYEEMTWTEVIAMKLQNNGKLPGKSSK